PIESFFGHFKTESYHLKKYKTYEELVADVESYIQFYNTQRYQNPLGIQESGCLISFII
ncbi:IS3 family transposase, partial [Streptococcus acidominimus]